MAHTNPRLIELRRLKSQGTMDPGERNELEQLERQARSHEFAEKYPIEDIKIPGGKSGVVTMPTRKIFGVDPSTGEFVHNTGERIRFTPDMLNQFSPAEQIELRQLLEYIRQGILQPQSPDVLPKIKGHEGIKFPGQAEALRRAAEKVLGTEVRDQRLPGLDATLTPEQVEALGKEFVQAGYSSPLAKFNKRRKHNVGIVTGLAAPAAAIAAPYLAPVLAPYLGATGAAVAAAGATGAATAGARQLAGGKFDPLDLALSAGIPAATAGLGTVVGSGAIPGTSSVNAPAFGVSGGPSYLDIASGLGRVGGIAVQGATQAAETRGRNQRLQEMLQGRQGTIASQFEGQEKLRSEWEKYRAERERLHESMRARHEAAMAERERLMEQMQELAQLREKYGQFFKDEIARVEALQSERLKALEAQVEQTKALQTQVQDDMRRAFERLYPEFQRSSGVDRVNSPLTSTLAPLFQQGGEFPTSVAALPQGFEFPEGGAPTYGIQQQGPSDVPQTEQPRAGRLQSGGRINIQPSLRQQISLLGQRRRGLFRG